MLALSAVLNTHRLSQNQYANTFYSAGVKSMLRSLHNLLFVSFDPGGLITVDKPPLGLWLQVASAKLFGFSPLSLLLPEAIAGVLAVAALYWAMSRSFGPTAALIGALALAVFPSFVAVSRDNNVDALLILLMTLSCGTALRAIESGRMRWLIACAVLIGLAFNTKTLAAYLMLPGITLAYVACAPGPLRRRLLRLSLAGILMGLISISWLTFVDLTPASKRPYVGGSTNNSELGLTFGYNGLGRVGGQQGGPGSVIARAGAMPLLPKSATHSRNASLGSSQPGRAVSAEHKRIVLPAPHQSKFLPDGRARAVTPFGGPTGPLRLFGSGLGGQGGWMVPFALFALIALGLSLLFSSRRLAGLRAKAKAHRNGGASSQASGERDPRVAGLIVLGGWFLVEATVLSFSKGIVHPYYVSAMGPGSAAMIGAGAITFAELGRRRGWLLALAPLAVGATVAVQLVLLHRDDYMHWFVPVLITAATLGMLALIALKRLASAAVALTLAVLLIAPAAYATTTWGAPVEGTFPAAGPHAAAGLGPNGIKASNQRVELQLLHYIEGQGPGSRWSLLAVSSVTAAPFILLGANAGSLGGYSGTDPALNGRQFARLVARREARYVLLGGAYASRGGNGATVAVLQACKEVPESTWRHVRYLTYFSLVLFDCQGRARQLAAAP